ncbi:MAG: succinate-semialdehyde dehydrogenase (NADP(+)) [Alteromonadaceae bacterium]|uniref:NAD-dependent succinate-semialdehyde dehydrogenase n=1 Tax=Paraglaciecola chathamensis TaxID=368405 RepID=UPI000C5860DD|nr:NAD-dependent succinate-semialdehyde dehydrogenase [Paraglaciecola agarilytica]MBN26419.1 succinate-semialdehyde dehydrogenase (NADP(+)) [Alteromonadaceae bacterium]|tara:strand:- start:47129 stop:48619 length:1491 start_codon:yes stop_codon:yes gene_type:complete
MSDTFDIDLASSLREPTLLNHRNYINGQWKKAVSTDTYEVMNPATGQSITGVANSDAIDAVHAARSARQAFNSWQRTTHRERASLLEKWHGLIEQHMDDIACIMSSEQGKPLAESKGEIAYGASYVKWFAQMAMQLRGDILPDSVPGRQQTVEKRPVGVVAVITPWNFPFAMLARKIAPALAAGCTVVVKPAEDTPLTALAMAKLADMAGFPPGIINVITASREQTAIAVDAWLKDVHVKKISFTGSTQVGRYLAERAATSLKKLSLELGGNAPFIVFEDCDIDAAISGLLAAKLRNGGQTCVCPNRIYVANGIYDEFASRLVDKVAAMKVGDPFDEATQIGPMINQKAIDKITHHVQDAEENGGILLCGSTNAREGFFFEPVVIADANNKMALFSEETFGPVLPLFRFHTEHEAIEEANNTEYGLASYFYTQDHQRIHRVKRALQAGVIGVNEGAVASEVAPFGGVKASGYGREGSHYGLDDFLQLIYVCEGNLG